jgi:hypothetical protein
MRTYQRTAHTLLDRYDIWYGGHKSDAGVDFKIDMDFASPQRLKHIRNRTALFRCVFGSTDGYVVRKNWVSLG